MAKEIDLGMTDPIAYRPDYPKEAIIGYDPMADLTPDYLANMDMNTPISGANESYNQYGDDSSASSQQQSKGGLNEKYTGEGVKTDQFNYDENLRIGDLNPNFVYGRASQVYGTSHPGYITQRNDQIASALYNEGITDKEGIANFLSQQGGWMNSTLDDRLNTIDSIWKRMGQIKQEGEQEEAEQAEFDESRMEEGIKASEAGKIYGKVTADEGNPNRGINTLADENSVFESMKQDRINRVKEVYAMSSEKIAYLMSEGMNPISEMTMRDLMEFYPEKYNEIQAEYKKLIGQTNVDSISMGGGLDVTSQLTANEDNVTTSMNYFVNSTANGSAAGNLSTNLNNALAESEIASTAREQREVYKRKIVEIQQAAESLEKDANAYFKGDTPDYIVKAFINNRMQKYNREIEKYQQLYNASLDEEKREVSQQQWNTEMAYKMSSLNADINYKNANLALAQQELAYKMKKDEMSNGQWNDDGTYSYIDMNGVMHTVPFAEAEKILNADLYNNATSYIDYWQNAINNAKSAGLVLYGDQCEVMTDNYTNQYWGVTMTKEDGTATTLVEDKAKYVTDSIPERGFVAIWDYGITQSDGKNYGHTGIVIDYDPTTGIFTTLESNRKQAADGTPIITIQEQSINSANLLGFWDPTKGTPWNRKGETIPVDSYYDFPMVDIYADAYENIEGVEAKNKILDAQKGYAKLYDMKKTGGINALLDDDVANAIDQFTEGVNNLYTEVIAQGGQNAYLRTILDNEGNFVIDTMLQYLINTGKLNINPEKKEALDDMLYLIQIKLRGDSGAAINVSEWMQDYNLFLPQVGQSKKQRLKRISNLEHAIASSALYGDYLKQYIPVISQEWIDSLSEENKKDIIKGYED